MLEARQLTKCYASIPAVDDVSFTIRPGEILGYLGPNGSGKSTTVKMITGLLEPSGGHVLFRGADIKDDLPAYKNLLGYVPEEAMLYPYLTGWEYLDFVGTLRGMNRGRGENVGCWDLPHHARGCQAPHVQCQLLETTQPLG